MLTSCSVFQPTLFEQKKKISSVKKKIDKSKEEEDDEANRITFLLASLLSWLWLSVLLSSIFPLFLCMQWNGKSVLAMAIAFKKYWSIVFFPLLFAIFSYLFHCFFFMSSDHSSSIHLNHYVKMSQSNQIMWTFDYQLLFIIIMNITFKMTYYEVALEVLLPTCPIFEKWQRHQLYQSTKLPE